MKKTVKTTLLIIAVILSVVLLAAGCFVYLTRYRVRTIDTATSPDGEYELLFQSVGEPEFPFGASHARLVLKGNGRNLYKYDFDMANDGKVPDSENWKAEWQGDFVVVSIFGEEQEPEIYTFELKEHTNGTNSVF